MAANVDNGFAPVTLAVYRAPADTDGPTGTTGAPVGFTDMGALSLDDGYEFTPVGAGDKTVTKAFTNGGEVFFTSRSTSDDLPTWKFTFMETSLDVIEFVFGVDVTQTATDGSFIWKNAIRAPEALVIDLIDGKGEVQRDFIPAASIASVDALTIAGTDRLAKYVVTIEGDASSVLDGGAFQRWQTKLKTGA
jgi:hypothetical protein